jgi:hypothetical protein
MSGYNPEWIGSRGRRELLASYVACPACAAPVGEDCTENGEAVWAHTERVVEEARTYARGSHPEWQE